MNGSLWVTETKLGLVWERSSFSRKRGFTEPASCRNARMQAGLRSGRIRALAPAAFLSFFTPLTFAWSVFFFSAASFAQWEKKWTTSTPETFYFMALAAPEEISLTQVPRTNVPERNSVSLNLLTPQQCHIRTLPFLKRTIRTVLSEEGEVLVQ